MIFWLYLGAVVLGLTGIVMAALFPSHAFVIYGVSVSWMIGASVLFTLKVRREKDG